MTMYCFRDLSLCILQRFHLLREEVEKMTRQDALVHLHLLQGGIVVRRDDEVDAILEILVDNVDRPCFPVKHPIKNVGTPFIGVQAHTISCSHLPTGNSYRFWRRIVIQDDGRRKHCIAFSLVTDQHRPRADILTFLDKSLHLFRWLQQRNEGTLTYL